MSELREAEVRASAAGVVITPADRARITAAQRAELERLVALEGHKGETLIDAFNRYYPRLLEFLHGAGEVLMTTAQTLIVAFGIPVTLLLLLIVEHQRVYHGIALFESDPSLAAFAAAALVLLNLVLEFQIHHVELKAGWNSSSAQRWSAALAMRDLAYRVGWGKDWQPRPQSPAARYRRLLGLVTFAIIALALAGSMRAQIEATSGNWVAAIASIVSQSSLSDMLTWTGSLLFTLAAVLAAQGLSRYVALRCAEIVNSMQSSSDPLERHAAHLDAVAARVVDAIVAEKLNKRTRPFGSTVPEPVGTESIQPMHSVSGRIASVNGSKAHE